MKNFIFGLLSVLFFGVFIFICGASEADEFGLAFAGVVVMGLIAWVVNKIEFEEE